MEGPLIGIPKPIASRFYMAKDQEVARNLLTYRYNQLDKAIENAEKKPRLQGRSSALSNGYYEW
jgi:hypothetical protein